MTSSGKVTEWLNTARQRIVPTVAPGTYPYLRQADGQHTRIHLRVEEDGSGLLLANATMAARLTPSGATIARRLLDGDDPPRIARDVRHGYRGATPESVRADLESVQQLIATLSAPGDNYPILNLADTAFGVGPGLEKPLTADLPLADPERLVPILDRLWRIGIPHVIFQVLPRADVKWSVRAVERAEDLGMIAGVRGAASALSQGSLLKDLALAGVDHVDLYCLSADPAEHDAVFGPGDHDALRRAVAELLALEVCPVAEIPLLEQTAPAADATVEGLIPLGVANLAFFALAMHDSMPEQARRGSLTPDAVVQATLLIEESSADWSVRSLWYPPVSRDARWSLADQIRRGPGSSGDHAIRVAPDGNAYAPRGRSVGIGNVLFDDWPTIRSHLISRPVPSEPVPCETCPGLAICAAGCPRSPGGWVESWPDDVLDRKAPQR